MNIFARELNATLERHRLTISQLYVLRRSDGAPLIPPAKVARLQRSLTEDITAVLTEPELGALAVLLGLQPIEEQRLRAAIVGVAIYRLLAGRISRLSAMREAERVLDLLMNEEEEEQSLREELLHDTREAESNASLASADLNAAAARALEPAAEAAEQGELWLGVALETPDLERRRDLLRLAWAALDRAAELLAYAPSIAQDSPLQAEWRRTIELALTTIRQVEPIS